MTTPTIPTSASCARSRTVTMTPWGPTTADVLRALTATRTSLNDFIPIGVALHHLTDVLRTEETIGVVMLHRVTTALSRDVKAALGAEDILGAIAETVTDSKRPAFLHGPSIEEVAGEHWSTIQARARARSAAMRTASRDYGVDSILNLAALRGTEPDLPWWGTRHWLQIVEGCERIPGCTPPVREVLATTPDLADETILEALLFDH